MENGAARPHGYLGRLGKESHRTDGGIGSRSFLEGELSSILSSGLVPAFPLPPFCYRVQVVFLTSGKDIREQPPDC
jgi:hypothetical protein